MKKIIAAFIITALMACALVSCTEEGAEGSVAESSTAQEVESSAADIEVSVADESSEAVVESEVVSETVDESEESNEGEREEIAVKISMEYPTDELLADKDAYILYDDPDTDYSLAAFTTDTKVTNFRYFSVVATDTWSDDGGLKIKEILYTLDEFTPEMTFVAEVVFTDVYTCRGISFVDANGNTQYYGLYDNAIDDSIGVSRKDIAEKD